MVCSNCGAPVSENSKFCILCGTPVQKDAPIDQPVAEETVAESEAPVVEEVAAEEDIVVEEAEEAPEAAEEAEAPAEETTEEISEEAPAEEKEESDTPKKKGFVKIIVGAVVAIVAVLAFIGVIALVSSLFNGSKQIKTEISATVDEDGKAYICYDNGKMIKLGGDVEDAVLTSDGKKVVVTDEDGIYWCDIKASGQNKIFEFDEGEDYEERADVEDITDKFIVLEAWEEKRDAEGNRNYSQKYIRYDFATKSSVVVASWDDESEDEKPQIDYDIPYGGEAVYFVTAEDGNIKVLGPADSKPVKISTYDQDAKIDLCGISANGKIITWTEAKDGKYKVIVCLNGEKKEAFSDDLDYEEIPADDSYAIRSKFNTFISNTYKEGDYENVEAYRVAILNEWGFVGEDVTIDSVLGTDVYYETGTQNEEAMATVAEKLDEYFINQLSAPSFRTQCGAKGDVVIMTGAEKFIFVRNNKIVSGKLKGSDPRVLASTNGLSIERDTKFASAKGFYVLTQNEKDEYRTVYYISFKDGKVEKLISKCFGAMFGADNFVLYLDSKGTYKCGVVNLKDCEIEDENNVGKSKDISIFNYADVSARYLYYIDDEDLYVYDVKKDNKEKIESDVDENLSISTDGKTVYYFSDVDDGIGTLYSYNVKDAESVEIAEDVIVGSLTSHLASYEIKPKSMFFKIYQSSDEIDLCYFNGKEVKTLAEEIVVG